MQLSRRAFASGTFGLALSTRLGATVPAPVQPGLDAAVAAIRAYAEAHYSYFGLPGLTLGLTTPDGFATVENFGFSDMQRRTAIAPETLFQIGSITKSMVGAIVHQLAAEGRLGLTQRVSDILPAIPLPQGNSVTVQNLLDHSAGLADSTPLSAAGGLWTAYPPGAHWHYSNTGYEILGKVAEHVGGQPLDQLLTKRIFQPLGMTRSRGAILGADRMLYAQGYEAADQVAVYARGAPLAPAAWVDVTFGAGCVASTSADMIRFMRSLADAAQGRGGLGLSPAQARVYATHAVSSDTPGMSYGNGLMHVGSAGRAYLHHTGGMVSFSSSLHVDVASGAGAFASTPLSAFVEYRPRSLTLFAVEALTHALAGRPLPSPPSLDIRLPSPAAYAGTFSGAAGSFEVRAGNPLTIIADGQSAELQAWGGDIFRTLHPAFRQFSLLFERSKGVITGASWGPSSYIKRGSPGQIAPSDPELAKLAGRYIDDDPWYGAMIVVERAGKLWVGTETPMTRIGDNLWRVGQDSWSPERASFANPIDGRPQTFIFSGEKFARHDI